MTLSMILSAPVSDATQSYGVSQIQAPMGPVGHFSQAGAKATVQIKSLRDRPITIQQHTPSERRRGREREKGKVGAVVWRAVNSILMVLLSEKRSGDHGDLQRACE